ncbi:hypothetical protein K439DRAFT_1342447 [Ramaria rubella]|nr:hypothetical protein K439DRAFT_1342447 [Ramaria rubella]
MLGVDNQAALKTTQNTWSGSGDHLADKLLKVVDEAKSKHREINLRGLWTPGHSGIEGNEIADREAKKAASGDSSPSETLPHWCRREIPFSHSAAIQSMKK